MRIRVKRGPGFFEGLKVELGPNPGNCFSLGPIFDLVVKPNLPRFFQLQ